MVDFEPVQGTEANKTRPAIIVSNDAANRSAERAGKGVLTVVPVTSNTTRVYPFQLLLTAEACGLSIDSKAQAEQVRAVSVDRLYHLIGRVPVDLMGHLDTALRRHLAL
jgi:mRNA interferase MazF